MTTVHGRNGTLTLVQTAGDTQGKDVLPVVFHNLCMTRCGWSVETDNHTLRVVNDVEFIATQMEFQKKETNEVQHASD